MAPGRERVGSRRTPYVLLGRKEQGARGGDAVPRSQTLSTGEADIAVRGRGEAWGRKAINSRPTMYPLGSRRWGDKQAQSR